jgi:hypothetical protein
MKHPFFLYVHLLQKSMQLKNIVRIVTIKYSLFCHIATSKIYLEG